MGGDGMSGAEGGIMKHRAGENEFGKTAKATGCSLGRSSFGSNAFATEESRTIATQHLLQPRACGSSELRLRMIG